MFLLDELIYNVYREFSHRKKENNNQIYYTLHYLFMCFCFTNESERRGYITFDELSLLLMENHKCANCP